MDVSEEGMNFPRSSTKSKRCCCVFGCKSYAKKNPNLRFHRLPKAGQIKVEIINKLNVKEKIDRRQVWVRRLKISEKFSNPVVCSLHFTKEDYFPSYGVAQKMFLKKTAVPSVNLPIGTLTTLKQKEKNLLRIQRIENRATKSKFDLKPINNENEQDNPKNVDNSTASSIDTGSRPHKIIRVEDFNITPEIPGKQTPKNVENSTASSIDTGSRPHKIIRVEDFNITSEIPEIENNTNFRPYCLDKGVQVEFEKYSDFIKNEKDLSSMTGLGSFSLLVFLEDIVKVVIPTIELNLCKKTSQLSIKDRIILTFIKLKKNFTYTVLSIFFNIRCEETCRTIFLRMLDILAAGLKFAICWPSKQEILENLPEGFEEFADVRAVIDGIEITIHKPKKACCQSDSYSSKKSTHTVKFMTAFSLDGLITFISKAYPGRSSDEAVFEQSKLIEKLDPNDDLMVGKNFSINDICLKNNINLVQPPSTKRKKQLTEEEALLDTSNKDSVHIEWSNQHLRVFKILNEPVPSYLVGRVEQILYVICAIVNLNAPMSKGEKVMNQ